MAGVQLLLPHIPGTNEQPQPSFGDCELSTRRWNEVRQQFLSAVAAELRPLIEQKLLLAPHGGGAGLRLWLNAIFSGASVLPKRIPSAIVEVFLTQPDALPLHDCANCGLAVPVIPSRYYGFEGEPARIFFPACPGCGGPTGWCQHSSRWVNSAR